VQQFKTAKKAPDPIDIYVGSRVRMRRLMLDMSQEKLAAAIGVSFQQIQKYEKGKNRIGSSRMQMLSSVLGVPVSFFFDGVPGNPEAASENALVKTTDYVTDFITSSEGIAIARAFSKIEDNRVKRRLVDLIEVLAVVA
jgi:transcriptional regulator with XRE-family HTH domain